MEDTKTRIMDAAERLLSEQGFAAGSLRAITAAAGVNLGAVNYHFRSKKALIHAVLARRLEPLNRARLAALDACETRAGGKPVPLEELLEAFLEPVMSMGKGGAPFMRLMGMIYSEPTIDIHRIFSAELGPTVQRFLRAFGRTLPGLPPEELFWRLFFTVGAMAQTLAAGGVLRFLSGGRCDPLDLAGATTRLIRYSAAGLNAPVAGRAKKGREQRRA